MDTGHPCQKHQGGAKVALPVVHVGEQQRDVQAARVLPEQLLEQHAGRAQMADRNRVAGAGDELVDVDRRRGLWFSASRRKRRRDRTNVCQDQCEGGRSLSLKLSSPPHKLH